MESKYNIENFERFLREKTDEFRMYPSKRVWYSIYNNMHPGNRMPSISMCIVLIFSLLLVGYLNTDSSKQILANNEIQQTVTNISSVDFSKPFNKFFTSTNEQIINLQTTAINKPSSNTGNTIAKLIDEKNSNNIAVLSGYKKQLNNSSNKNITFNNNKIKSINTGTAIIFISNEGLITAAPLSKNLITNIELPIYVVINNTTSAPDNTADKSELITTDNTSIKLQNSNTAAQETTVTTPADKKVNNNKSLSETDKAWIENFALYNRPIPRNWSGKLSWQAYAAPSVVYRTLHNNATGKYLGGNAASQSFNNSAVDNMVKQKPSFGLEAGLTLQYQFAKRLKLKAGVQLNYTRYNVHGFENFHPIATTITLNSSVNETAYEAFRTTPFSNSYGLLPVKLHNETYQFSLPLGADFRIASVDNIEWYAGASIQPTYMVFGNSYLISTDRRNYVKENSMLNRFNLNAGFETYLSFKTSNYTWQIGPQFRSQIFSTNSKLYSIEERLQSYGFKIGISKKL